MWKKNNKPSHPSTAAPLSSMSRRRFLILSGATGIASAISIGCDYFPPESGPAYAPWDWPTEETRPEWRAVGAAILAASPHNTQPWRFELRDRQIDIYADLNQSLGPLDGFHREMYIGLGCALENLRLVAEASARDLVVSILPDDDETHIANLVLTGDASPNPSPPLVRRISKRHTNRGPYVDRSVPSTLEEDLNDLIEDEEVRLTLIRTEADRKAFAENVVDATRAIIDDTQMNEESHRWYRHSEREIEKHRDGLTLDPTGVGAGTRFFGKIGGRPDASKAAQYWLKNTIRYQTTAGAFCILSLPERHNRLHEILCGQTFQRLHLFADSVGLAVHPLNQMPERADREEAIGIEPVFTSRLQEFVGDGGVPLMVFRIGYPLEDTFASCRKPVDWVAKEVTAI